MSDPQLDTANRNPSSKAGGMGGTIFLIVFATPFAGVGLFAVVEGLGKLIAGQSKDGLMLCLFGLVFSTVGFGLMLGAIWGRRKSKQTAELQARNPDKPWLMRADWAAGRIKSSATAQANLLLIMALAFCGIGGLVTGFVLPAELHKGNYPALIVLLFPLAGLGLLAAFVATWRSRRRFGECSFELAQIPAPLGGTLEGMIQTGARLRLEHGLHLKISCLRRVTTGSGDNRSTHESVLWQDEKVIAPNADLPEPEPGQSGIPVFFKIPANQPECSSHGDEAVIWRLEARTKMSGPDFCARFDVPVFQVAGTTAAGTDAEETDSSAPLQESVDELRRDEDSKIQVTDGPSGHEFYFPPARNVGTAIFLTAFFIIWSGFLYLLLVIKAPLLFPIVWGVTDMLVAFGVFNAWFKSSRITVDSNAIRATNRWLIFSRTREFSADRVARFETKAGMQSGSQVFTDIRLIPRGSDEEFAAKKERFQQPQNANQLAMQRLREAAGPRGVTVAGGIANIAEARWLAAEMNKALGRKQ